MKTKFAEFFNFNIRFAALVCIAMVITPFTSKAKTKKKENSVEAWFKDHGTGRTFCDPFAKECNPATGLMLIIDEDADDFSVGSCTGFLVGPDLMISNGHCPPDNIKTGSQPDCKGKIFFSLPQTEEFTEEVFGCEKILKYTDSSQTATGEKVFHSDYAVIKLDHPSKYKRWLEISDEGLPDNLAVKIFKIKALRPNEKKKKAKMVAFQQMQECSFVHGTVLLPSFNHRFRPVGIMPECHIHRGESGSPIIDSNGKVRAILQAGTLIDEDLSVVSKKSAAILKKRMRDAFAVASNFACIDPLSLNLPVRPECLVTIDSDEAKQITVQTGMHIYRKFETEFQELIDSLAANNVLEKPFLWQPSALDTDAITAHVFKTSNDEEYNLIAWGFSIPKCIERTASSFAPNDEANFLLTRPEKALIFSEMPFWPIYRTLNRGKATLLTGKEIRYLKVIIEYSPGDAEKTGRSTVKISHNLNEYVEVILFEGEVPACHLLPAQCLP